MTITTSPQLEVCEVTTDLVIGTKDWLTFIYSNRGAENGSIGSNDKV